MRGLEDGDAIAAVRDKVFFVQSFPSGSIVVPMFCLVVHLGCRCRFHSDTFLVISFLCTIVVLLAKAKKTAARSKKAKQAKASKSKKSKAAAKLVKERDGGGGGSTKVDKK